MPGCDRGDRGALIALALVVSAVVIIFMFGGFGDPTNQIVEGHAQPNGGGKNAQGEAVEAVYWGVFTARDTLAQWIAAGAAIFSAAVSIWAVRLVNHSLAQTRIATEAAVDSNRIAREVGAAQVRAYVGIDVVRVDIHDIAPSLRYTPQDGTIIGVMANTNIIVTMKNFGVTPANGVVLFGGISVTKGHGRLPREYFTSVEDDRIDHTGIRQSIVRPIIDREKTIESIIPIWDAKPFMECFENTAKIYFHGRIYYRDIFNRNWRRYFCYEFNRYKWPDEVHFFPYEHYNGEDEKEGPEF